MHDDDWKTPEIREAEMQIEAAMAHAEQVMASADQLNQSLPESKLSREQTEQIEQLVRSGKAPEEIRALQERIDAGDMSWDDIASGRGLDDEGVQQALSAGIPNMQRAKELLDEGHDVDAIIDADPNRPAASRYDDDEPPDSFLR